MRRIPWLLVLVAGLLAIISGSALAAAGRAAASPPANSSLPTISGTASEGQTLTASSGAWSGATPIGYAYQWQRCNSSGTNCGSIGKATSQNYVVSKGDVAKTIRVEVTATNTDGKNQALSAATGAIAELGSAPASAKQPTPAGTATVGQTITIDDGGWSGSKPITFNYQWQSCTGSQPCKDIGGMTGSSFVMGRSQIGSMLRATVTATNSAGKSTTFSNLTGAVLALAGSPVNSSLPTISGPRTVGQTLYASTGAWNGVAANGFSYQWSRCGTSGYLCVNLPGATGQSYGIPQDDLGMALRVNVTAKNSIGSTMATSASVIVAK